MSDQTHEPTPEFQIQSSDVANEQGGDGRTIANGQTLGTQECPNCGAENHASATICHACGEHLRQPPKNIRCRQCGQRASSSLIICPHCGRELHPAPSRLWTWVVPSIVGLLLLIFLFSRVQGGPFAWTQDQVGKGVAWISGVGAGMAPDVVIAMTPVVEAANVTGVVADTVAFTDSDATVAMASSETSADQALLTEETSNETDQEVNAEGEAQPLEPTVAPVALEAATSTPMPTVAPTDAPTDTPSETPTSAPTATPTSMPTEKPTEKPTPTLEATKTRSATVTSESASNVPSDEDTVILQPTTTADKATTAASIALVPTDTPTAVLQYYTVRAGDTLLDIASRFAVSVDALMAANDIAPGEAYTLSVGERLVIPAPDGQGGPTTQSYTVRAGDTFLAIANRFDLSVGGLQSANGLTDEEVRLLRPGQVLVIPSADDALASTAPATATSTSAPTSAPTVTATPVPTTPPLRLDTVQLRSPENDAFVSCQGNDQLAWGGVNFILPTDEYVLHLGFVNEIDEDGNESVTWILHQTRPSARTSWEVDNDLCGLAPQEFGRQWRWYVDVVDEAGQTVSNPSEIWGFSWN